MRYACLLMHRSTCEREHASMFIQSFVYICVECAFVCACRHPNASTCVTASCKCTWTLEWVIPIPLPQHQHTFCQRRRFDQDCPGLRQVEMNKKESAWPTRPGQSWSKRRLWQKVCWCWGRGIGIIMTTLQERTCSLEWVFKCQTQSVCLALYFLINSKLAFSLIVSQRCLAGTAKKHWI